MIDLPITQEGPHFSFVSDLEGVAYTFEFRWNDRESGWFLTLGDGEGVPIVAGVRVVVNYPLLSRFTDARLPTGFLFAFDSNGLDEDPAFEDLGRRTILTYGTRAEVEAA